VSTTTPKIIAEQHEEERARGAGPLEACSPLDASKTFEPASGHFCLQPSTLEQPKGPGDEGEHQLLLSQGIEDAGCVAFPIRLLLRVRRSFSLRPACRVWQSSGTPPSSRCSQRSDLSLSGSFTAGGIIPGARSGSRVGSTSITPMAMIWSGRAGLP